MPMTDTATDTLISGQITPPLRQASSSAHVANLNIDKVNNRNPRNGELTGSKPKKLGLGTLPSKHDFHYR